MSGSFFKLFLFSSLLITLSCSEIELKETSEAPDVIPPGILDLVLSGPDSVEFEFTKEILPLEKVFLVSPDIGIRKIEKSGSSLIINFENSQEPGTCYYIKGGVRDDNNNTLTFCAEFYGFNPFIPDIIINELTTQGSSTHPDMTELYVMNDGNMAGITFFEGTKEDHDSEFVFPPFEVKGGDYIIIHCKPEGIIEEITETSDKSVSGGIDSSPTAWDVWPSGFSGLSGNNGVLSLYTRPGGELLDCFLYSNRTSVSDENYRGFGSISTMLRVDYIADEGGWTFSGALIAPEDCVNPDDSTATRSICRDSAFTDTDDKSDWHIVPTSSSTFGSINSDEIYIP